MKIRDFQVRRSEIIQTDRYKAICERLGIPYFKIDFLSKSGAWRGQRIKKTNFNRLKLLVTGHSDFPLDEQRFRLAKPHLKRWFSTNVTHADPRLVGIPLGVTNYTDETPLHLISGNLDPLLASYGQPKKLANLIYMNFSIETFPQERQPVFDLFKDHAFVTNEPVNQSVTGHRCFLRQIYDHQFVLCPRGNGIDTVRMWEALYLKSIPIVRRCHAMSFFQDLPILFVDRWEEALDPQFLERMYHEFHNREWNMEKLNVSYWERQFRMTQETRKVNPLRKTMRSLFDKWFVNFKRDPYEGQMMPEERRALYNIILEKKPECVFEIGTWKGGGSTYFIAHALKKNRKGTLYTIEADREFFDHARNLYETHLKSLKPYIRFHLGKSDSVYPAILENVARVDLLFLDGAENAEQTIKEFHLFMPKLAARSVVACHDWKIHKMEKLRPLLESDPQWKCIALITDSPTGFSAWEKIA